MKEGKHGYNVERDEDTCYVYNTGVDIHTGYSNGMYHSPVHGKAVEPTATLNTLSLTVLS